MAILGVQLKLLVASEISNDYYVVRWENKVAGSEWIIYVCAMQKKRKEMKMHLCDKNEL